MDWNIPVWVGPVLLALAFGNVGYSHAFGFEAMAARMGMGWLHTVGPSAMRVIGVLEIVAAVGLILPALSRVLPWLTPLAAALLALLMVLAAIFHARRPGEVRNITLNVILGVIAAAVAYGRFVVAPF